MFACAATRRIIAVTLALATVALSGCSAFLSKPLEKWPEPEELTAEQTSVWSLAYSPDGKYLISSDAHQQPSNVSGQPSGHAMFQLWGTGSLALCEHQGHLATFRGPDWNWRARDHRFSSDGKFVFTTTFHGLMRWDIDQQRLDTRFVDHSVVLSPDCKTAVCVKRTDLTKPLKEEDRNVEIWDVEQEQCVGILGTESLIGSPIQFLQDGRLVAVIGGGSGPPESMVVWHLPSRTKTVLDVKEPSYLMAAANDGRRIMVQDESDSVAILDSLSGRRLAAIPCWETARRPAISPDGSLLAIGGESSDPKKKHGEIQLWDIDAGQLRTTFTVPTTWGITALCFSPDGKTLASGDGDGAIRLWKVPGVADVGEGDKN